MHEAIASDPALMWFMIGLHVYRTYRQWKFIAVIWLCIYYVHRWIPCDTEVKKYIIIDGFSTRYMKAVNDGSGEASHHPSLPPIVSWKYSNVSGKNIHSKKMIDFLCDVSPTHISCLIIFMSVQNSWCAKALRRREAQYKFGRLACFHTQASNIKFIPVSVALDSEEENPWIAVSIFTSGNRKVMCSCALYI